MAHVSHILLNKRYRPQWLSEPRAERFSFLVVRVSMMRVYIYSIYNTFPIAGGAAWCPWLTREHGNPKTDSFNSAHLINLRNSLSTLQIYFCDPNDKALQVKENKCGYQLPLSEMWVPIREMCVPIRKMWVPIREMWVLIGEDSLVLLANKYWSTDQWEKREWKAYLVDVIPLSLLSILVVSFLILLIRVAFVHWTSPKSSNWIVTF